MLNSNNFDWSYVISGITLVVAIVSPVLVTILNNYHNSKIRKLELDYQKQLSYYQKQEAVFSSFLESASKQINADYQSERVEYMQSYNHLFLYSPEEYWEQFKKLNEAVIKRDKDESTKLLSSTAVSLGKILQESALMFPKL
jgi:hypothetical protein